MNVLLLSFDESLLDESTAETRDSISRHLSYAEELRRRVPGSQVWAIVRGASSTGQQPRSLGEGLAVIPAGKGALEFITNAYRLGYGIHRAQGLDLISSQSPFSDGLVAWALHRRCHTQWLAQLHLSTLDNPYWVREKRMNRVRSGWGKLLLRQADAVRVVSQTAASWLTTSLRVSTDKVFVLPVATTLPAEKRGRPTPSGPALLLFVGELAPHKGTLVLLDAFSRLKQSMPDATLWLAGEGRQRAELEQSARQKGLEHSIRFLGFVAHEALFDLYLRASLLVVPSRHEAYGRVIAEAMSAECVVVTTDTEGARDLVQDGQTGFVVPVDDVDALTEKMLYVLRNPQVAQQVRASASQWAAQLRGPQSLAAEWVQVWLRVAGR